MTDEQLSLDELRARGRGADGKFTEGNLARLTTGARSRQLLAADGGELAPLHALLVAEHKADLGGQISAATAHLVNRLATVELLAEAAEADILLNGLTSGKGRTRAMVSIYLQMLDRQIRIAERVGLESSGCLLQTHKRTSSAHVRGGPRRRRSRPSRAGS